MEIHYRFIITESYLYVPLCTAALKSHSGLVVCVHLSNFQDYSRYIRDKHDSMIHATQNISEIETTSMSSTGSLKVKALLVDLGEIFIV
jgi:hypothetical protein